ncbi:MULTISPECIES: flagellar hook assembly protein FlgD [unclassified Halomonas]|uniref:flagellar hook assembly protein FlgD n=1 Tax=unclassified Halomonas TaxID=2609666 RepID=UPI0007F12E10|nr:MULTISPECIES: flagellar hook assembly protein FlgD [unclassified Halomonas]SBR52393.1 flagellar basal-body rod modification protein FlgD [Halomonas sp. HL-93]SNY98032.1 flagellar basal-body rod modification protein FlgD [Halomonas sp. hl-4]
MNIDTSVLSNVNGGGSNGMPARQSEELRESFMTLLITQLENQDPMNPMENAEMTSQLAQINTVSGIEELNDTISGITKQMDASQMLQASGLIGNSVLVPGDQVKVSVDEDGNSYATPFGIELEEPAEKLEISVTNQAGEVVYSNEVEGVDAGVESFSWNGLNNDEVAVPEGSYNVSYKATDAEGEKLDSETLNYAQVQGVTPAESGEEVRLDLGAIYGQVSLDQIKQIL